VKKKTRVFLVGYWGKMGTMIRELATKEFIEFEMVEAFDKTVKLVIDFSTPDGLQELLLRKEIKGLPILSGTTGLSSRQRSLLKKHSKSSPTLWCSNTSFGVFVVRKMLKGLKNLNNAKVHIEEIHHIHKKDVPSGTALTLQQEIQSTSKHKVNIESHRFGEIPGVHKIIVDCPEEKIVIEHTALDRKLFARGALEISKWLVKQKRPGFLELEDYFAAGK
jgi:4-hydroxy-tetrahydrodipicolinate reductase